MLLASIISLQLKGSLEIFTSGSVTALGEVFGGAFRHDLTTMQATFWPHINHPVSGFDHMKIVLDNNHAIATIDELTENIQETLDVVGMEARSRLIEDIESLAGAATREFGSQLDALCFPARKSAQA